MVMKVKSRAEISEIIRAPMFELSMQIQEVIAQRKFVSVKCQRPQF